MNEYRERLVKRYDGFILPAVLLAALGVLVLGRSGAAQAAPETPCDVHLQVELSSDVPNPHDPGFISSLLGNHPDYRLTLQDQDSASPPSSPST